MNGKKKCRINIRRQREVRSSQGHGTHPDLTFVTPNSFGQPIHPQERGNFSKTNWMVFSIDLNNKQTNATSDCKSLLLSRLSKDRFREAFGKFMYQDGTRRAKYNTRNTTNSRDAAIGEDLLLILDVVCR